MAACVMVVEDEEITSDILRKFLEAEHYEVLVASSAGRAQNLLRSRIPDLIIMDRNLPDKDGLKLCQEIRQNEEWKGIPILFLTAKKSMTDKVTGLRLGGDDYLAKPFDAHELLARVEALLRRAGALQAPPPFLQFEELRLDLARIEVTLSGKRIDLWPKEFEVLRLLLAKRGRVLSREFLLQSVWGYDKELEITTKTVAITVSRLRKKLGPYGERIYYVKGYGYRFDELKEEA